MSCFNFIEVKVQEGIEKDHYNMAVNIYMISHIEEHEDVAKGTKSIIHMSNGDWYYCEMTYKDLLNLIRGTDPRYRWD